MSVRTASTINHKSTTAVAMSSPTADAERLTPAATRRRARRTAREPPRRGPSRSLSDGQLARPPAEVVLATKLMHRRFDQRPPQPRRPGLGDPPAPVPAATALDARHQPGVTRQVRAIGKAVIVPISARTVTLNTGPKPGRVSKARAIGSVAAIVRIAVEHRHELRPDVRQDLPQPRRLAPAHPGSVSVSSHASPRCVNRPTGTATPCRNSNAWIRCFRLACRRAR